MRLVRRDGVDPELRTPVKVQADHQSAGLVPGDHRGHRVEETADRVHRTAVGRGDRGRDPEERPKPHAGAVEQQQRRGHARHPASSLARMGSDRFDADVYGRRVAAAIDATATAGLAGLVITPGYDLRYLVGSRAQTFERLTALVLPVSGDPMIVVPRLELASLKQSAVTDLGLVVRDWVDGDDPYQLVAAAMGGAPIATAVTDSMPALHLLPLADVLGALPVLATDVLRELRMGKDAAEADALRKAGGALA